MAASAMRSTFAGLRSAVRSATVSMARSSDMVQNLAGGQCSPSPSGILRPQNWASRTGHDSGRPALNDSITQALRMLRAICDGFVGEPLAHHPFSPADRRLQETLLHLPLSARTRFAALASKRILRIKPDGFVKVLDRVVVFLFLQVRTAAAGPSQVVISIIPYGFIKVFDRLVVVFLGVPGQAAGGVGSLWYRCIEPDSFVVILDRLVEVMAEEPKVAAVLVKSRHLWIEPDGFVVILDRLAEVALLHPTLGAVEEKDGVIQGRLRQRLGIGFRLFDSCW